MDTEIAEKNTEVTETPAEQATDVAEPTDGGQPGSIADLPEWAQKQLTKARNEAGNYRTQLREAQEALTKAKSPEDFATIADQLAAAQRQLIIRDNTEGLPKEIVNAEWVNWPSDEDGIKKTAESLRALVAQQASNEVPEHGGELSGGLNPKNSGVPIELDPAKLAQTANYFRNR